jgi:hypothetical protein
MERVVGPAPRNEHLERSRSHPAAATPPELIEQDQQTILHASKLPAWATAAVVDRVRAPAASTDNIASDRTETTPGHRLHVQTNSRNEPDRRTARLTTASQSNGGQSRDGGTRPLEINQTVQRDARRKPVSAQAPRALPNPPAAPPERIPPRRGAAAPGGAPLGGESSEPPASRAIAPIAERPAPNTSERRGADRPAAPAAQRSTPRTRANADAISATAPVASPAAATPIEPESRMIGTQRGDRPSAPPAVHIGTLDIRVEPAKQTSQTVPRQPVSFRGSSVLSRLYLRRV